jgi:hypothetical protein
MTAVSGERPAADADLRALSGQSSALFASLAGPAHLLEAANPTFFAMIGDGRGRTGIAFADLMPEAAGQDLLTRLDEVYRTGEPYTGRDIPVELGTGPAFFDFTCEPRHAPDGTVIGIRLLGVETTQVKHAEHLMAEHRALLEQIARQAPLSEVLDGMARSIEDLAPQEVLVSVLLADPDGRHLRHGAAPSLPGFYNQAIDGIATGEGVGSCGTAALAIERHHIEQEKAAAEQALAEAVRVERELRAEAEQRAAAASELTGMMQAAAAAQAALPHPEHCQLGGATGCPEPAEIKIADSWGDAAWGCPDHVEEAIINVRSVFIASEELGGLNAYLNR